MGIKFYICKHCGSVAMKIVDSGVPLVCCGEEMAEYVPNTVDAAAEKHVPVIEVEGSVVTVTVGEVEHPMAEEHFIQFILLETEQGSQAIQLKPGDAPQAKFELHADDKPVRVFAHCNLHGLWVAEA